MAPASKDAIDAGDRISKQPQADPAFRRQGTEMLDTEAVPISDVSHVRAILIASARLRRPMTYSELLDALGHRFSRPKMRALCNTLDAIDAEARAAGEPELAVLVVRASDGLPGQGWWVGGRPRNLGYAGPWSGSEAVAFVSERQVLAFAHWAQHACLSDRPPAGAAAEPS